jgi:hypothetical protein
VVADKLDPEHAGKRATLNAKAKLGLKVGLVACVLGAIMFSSTMLIAASISSPAGFGLSALVGVGGMFLLGGGSLAIMISGMIWLFTNSGAIGRYHAAEQVPVTQDVMREMTGPTADMVEELTGAVRDGLEKGRRR